MLAAACALWVAERLVASGHGVAGPALSWRARFALLGLHVATVLAIALVVLAIARLRVARPRVAVALAAIAIAVPAALAGRALAAGPWIATQWFAPLLIVGPALLGAALGALAARFASLPGPMPAIALGVAAIGAIAADATISVGHHPAFHLAAWLTAAVATTLGSLRAVGSRQAPAPRTAAWVFAAIAALSVVSLGVASEATRAELLLRSPLSREVLRATTLGTTTRIYAELSDLGRTAHDLADPPTAKVPTPARASVLLVTIDALRADALPPVRTGDREHARTGDTPNIDAFVASGVAFRHAYAPASFTMRSLPATFASRPALEDPEALDPALPRAMAASGRVPLAVVDRYFIEEPEGRALLEGFARVEVHAGADMKDGVDQMLRLLDDTGDDPYFAWLHLFATHAPGYAGRPLKGRDGSWPVRYRKSVRWVDREIGRLLDGLAARGLDATTIVVLSSDHGEGLGDNGIDLHGETVFEEETRVPLIVRIPGHPGVTVDATVSLLDLAPTLLQLVDAPPSPRMVGRSLVPLLAEPDRAWPYDVSTMSRRDTYAIVRGRDKLVYDAGADVMLRFDLARDPAEDRDVFGVDPSADAGLRSAFVRAHPALFAHELDDPRTQALLLERVRSIDLGDPSTASAHEFLLELCALAPDHAALEAALEPFAESDDATRLRIARALLPAAPEIVGERVAAHLGSIAGTPAETAFVEALALSAPPPFSESTIAARLGWWIEHGRPEDARPWLVLVEAWPHKPAAFAPALARILTTRPTASAEVIRRALAAAEGLDAPRDALRSLDTAARSFLDHADPGVRAAACSALVTAGAPDVLPELAAVLDRDREDIRVRQACLRAAALVAGEDAVALVIEHAEDPLLTFYAIRLLETLRSEAAIPYLEATIEREKRGRIHAAATLALRRTRAE